MTGRSPQNGKDIAVQLIDDVAGKGSGLSIIIVDGTMGFDTLEISGEKFDFALNELVGNVNELLPLAPGKK